MSFSLQNYILDCNAYLKEAESFFNSIAKNPGIDVERFLEFFCVGEHTLAIDTLSLLKCLDLVEVKSWKLEARPIPSISRFRLMVWKKLQNLHASNDENGITFRILDYLHKKDQRTIASVEELVEDVNRTLILTPSEREINIPKMNYWIRHMRDLGALIPIGALSRTERTIYLIEYSPDLVSEILPLQPTKIMSLEQCLKTIENFLPCRKNNLEPSRGIVNALLTLHCLKSIRCFYEADKGVYHEFPNLGRVNCIQVGD